VTKPTTTPPDERKPLPPNRGRVSRSLSSSALRRAVYDGRDRLGEIVQRGQEYVAFDRRGQQLGIYDTTIEAAQAVSDAASPIAAGAA
jgi:hypothetical protein